VTPGRLIACGLLACVSLAAQTITGSITGTVADQSSLPVTGATVTLTNQATGAQRETQTDVRADFLFSGLAPGQYDLSVRYAGFKTVERSGIVLSASERLSVGQIVLAVGEVAEKVTVSEQIAAVQTASAERAGVITSAQVDTMPIKGRNISSLIQLLPGVVLLSDSDSLSRTFSFSVQGNNTQFNQISLDGVPISQQDVQTPTVSQDAIAEVKVLLTNYQAEYGRLSGANVQLVSKSGSREFHGSGAYYKRHEQWNANNFFNNRLGRGVPIYRYNTWNYTIGGPVFIPGKLNRNRDKLFFFWSQEGWPLKTSDPVAQRTVPTELERAGDFSRSFDLNGALIVVTDPTTRTPFPGNRVPASRLDPNGVALLNAFPTPNFTDLSISRGNYNYLFPASRDNPLGTQTLKLDYNINSRNLLYGTYTWSKEERTGAIGMGGFNSSNWPQMSRTTARNGRALTLRHQGIFSPRLINEATFGFTEFPERDIVPDSELARNQRETLGYELGQFVPEANPLNLIPSATFGGVPNAANLAVERRLPQAADQGIATVVNNLSWSPTSHLIKTGFYLDLSWRDSYNPSNFNGLFDFSRNASNPLDTGYAYANAALGVFASYTETSNRVWYKMRSSNIEWFVQDTWKLTRRLTLDYGVRFYLIRPQYDAADQVSGFLPERFDPAQRVQLLWPARVNNQRVAQNRVTGETYPAAMIGAIVPGVGNPNNGLVVPSQDGSVPRAFAGDQGVRLGPRVGFAWDPFGKGTTAVRGGFGLFSAIDQERQTSLMIGQAPLVQNPIIYYGTMSTLLSSAGSIFPPAITTRDLTGHLPTTMNFSFSVQQNIGANIVVDAGYVGSLGRHLWRLRDLNWIPFGANFRPENRDPSLASGPLAPSFLRPYTGFAEIPKIEYDATSNYHSMQLNVNRRFTRGLQIGGAWTWSKGMDYGQGSNQNPGYISSQLPARWFYSLADIDRTHMLKLNWVWDLPKIPVGAKALDLVVNNWQISGIASFISGRPTGVGWSTTSAIDVTGTPSDSARIVVTGNPVLPKGERTFGQNFRTDAFRAPAVGTIGNAARTLLRQPGTNNWDITAAKNIPVHERFRIQLRCELYNAFNHTQFSSFDTTARFDAQGNQVNSNFGAFTAAAPARLLQLAVRVNF
jgi:hypothetical protein